MRTNRIIAGLALLSATTVAAQPTGRGFLFASPVGGLAVRAGWNTATAKSEIFDFTTENLTLDRGDFSAPSIAGDLSIRAGSRVDIVFGSGYSLSYHKSEFRDWVDNDDKPIEQTTAFERVPMTVSWKYYLTDRGRQISNFAWIPSKIAPYAGAGGGLMWYRFVQRGDFVDFQSLNVFNNTFKSQGLSFMAHGFAGVEYNMTPRIALTTDARMSWAKAEMSPDFSGFERIDLSGVSLTAGLFYRF